MAEHEPGEEYVGAAQVLTPGSSNSDASNSDASAPDASAPIDVEVQLRGHFEPNDGRFHWYGRIAANQELDTRHASGDRIALRTPHGIAAGKIADVDPWGRFRITGLGAPPF